MSKTTVLRNLFLKIIFNLFLDQREKKPLKKNVRKILFWGHMGLGNLVMFMPTIKAFRKHFKNATFYMVTGRDDLIELMVYTGLIDKFLNFGEKLCLTGKVELLKKILVEKFDLTIKTFNGAFHNIIGFSGIPYRIGHVSGPSWPIPQDSVFNYKVVMGKNEHEVDRNLRLFYAIECKGSKSTDKDFNLEISRDIQRDAIQILRQNNICKENKTIGMQVGTLSISEWKQWDLDKVATLTDILIGRYKIKVIFLGASEEKAKSRYVEGKMKNHPLNLTGKTTLLQTSAIIKYCKLFICNDTGLMHISIAVGTPVIAIFGPTDYTRTGPWKDGHTFIRKQLSCSPCYKTTYDRARVESCSYRKCLDLITVEDVLKAVKQQLKI